MKEKVYETDKGKIHYWANEFVPGRATLVFLNRILLSEGVSSPFMIGQSMGGYVAQAYMERFPHSVRGFISIDSAPLKRKYITAAELWLLKRVEPVYRAYPWKALIRSGAKGCKVHDN